MSKKKEKTRNYSFKKSKRINEYHMVEVNGVKIPSVPGSCYHAIICALAENKDKFCPWKKIIESVEKYMKKYGGFEAWKTFIEKDDVKPLIQRIKENTHTLTRTGKNCYGFRLHERGMCIYFFKDGAILLTGGQIVYQNNQYNVKFPGNKRLQHRYRGTTMTYNEYRKLVELGYVNTSGRILNQAGVKRFRDNEEAQEVLTHISVPVCVTLVEQYDQTTATRLEQLGLVVEEALDNELIGSIPYYKIQALKDDRDVVDVQQASI